MTAPPPLLDVLGARWSLAAPVTAVAWAAGPGGPMAAFGLGDGTIALATAAWPGAATLEPRPDGRGLQVAPASGPPPPLIRVVGHDGACLCLAADAAGFLSGGDDGRLLRIGRDGTAGVLAAGAGTWVDPLAAAGDARAWATGAVVHLQPAATAAAVSWRAPSSVAALAFDPTGGMLAIAHYGGVSLWPVANPGDPPRLLPWRGSHIALAWSGDGRYLASGLQDNAVHGWRLADGGDIELGGYPGQPRSLAFTADGRQLATAGAPRLVCWPFDPPGRSGPVEAGPAGRVPVVRLACHPARPVIAVGYHHGAVLLCRPGGAADSPAAGTLMVRGAGGGPVAALAWSAGGQYLALATEGGEAGLLPLPDRLFR